MHYLLRPRCSVHSSTWHRLLYTRTRTCVYETVSKIFQLPIFLLISFDESYRLSSPFPTGLIKIDEIIVILDSDEDFEKGNRDEFGGVRAISGEERRVERMHWTNAAPCWPSVDQRSPSDTTIDEKARRTQLEKGRIEFDRLRRLL